MPSMVLHFAFLSDEAISYLVFTFGVLFLYVGWSTAIKGRASRSWPSVDGKITKSEIKTSRSSGSSSSGSGKSYEFIVEYEYSFKGLSYSATRYSYQITYNSARQSGPMRLVHQYPVGSMVKVYVDPGYPENAVLLPGLNAFSFLPFVAAVVFFAFGMLMFFEGT